MRFRLRTLLIVVTVVAAGLGVLMGNETWVQPTLLALLSLCAIVWCTAAILGHRAAADIAIAGLIVMAFLLTLIVRATLSSAYIRQ
jgi:hypothetical protein